MYNVLTTTAGFQVILEAEEAKNLECSETGIIDLQVCLLLTCFHISISFGVGSIPQPPIPPPPQKKKIKKKIWLYLSPHSRARKFLLLISLTIINIGLSYVFRRKLFSIALHVLIAHKRNMAMVEVFMIYVTPTAMVIQRQNFGFIRKTEEGCKLTHDPKTYQISELKNGNFYTIFVVKFVLFVCLFFVF